MSMSPVIAWANAASKEELASWITERLHGRDYRWSEADDGFSPPGHLVALVACYQQTSGEAKVAIAEFVGSTLREVLPAWSVVGELVPQDAVAGGWSAPAVEDLLYLATEMPKSEKQRNELRSLFVDAVPKLPKRAGDIPLRTRALAAIYDLGGHPDMNFWLGQCKDDQPEALPLAFLGMAQQDFEESIAKLESRPLAEQGSVIRRLRPTLMKIAGGEIPFLVQVRRWLFREKDPRARELRDELAPPGKWALYLFLPSDVKKAVALGGTVLPSSASSAAQKPKDGNPLTVVVFAKQEDLDRAIAKIAVNKYLEEFKKKPTGRLTLDQIWSSRLRDYVTNIYRGPLESPGLMKAMERALKEREAELVEYA